MFELSRKITLFLLRQIYLVCLFFVRFCACLYGNFFLFHEKYVLFRPHFYMSIFAPTKLLHAGQKFSEKTFVKGAALFWNIVALIGYTQNFGQIFLSI